MAVQLAGAARPLQREIRVLVAALIVFLTTLIVSLLALALTILRMDRLTATADVATAAIAPLTTARGADLVARLDLLRLENGISRVEVYRDKQLYAAAGPHIDSAEVITRTVPEGATILFYFDASSWIVGRRAALVVGALATVATIAGLLILLLYIPKFFRPLEEMLTHASKLGERTSGDEDARYLVHSFREAVERIQEQARELDDLRTAASSRTLDLPDLARALNRNFSSGFLAVDAAGMVVTINDAGKEILGLKPEVTGESFPLQKLTPSFATVLQSSLESRVAVTRREVELETGELIGVTTVPLTNEDAFIGLFALFTNLTTFRAMEARLRDLENLVGLGQMSAGIAHEFRNSLFTILGYLRLAQRSASPEAGEKIKNAETEALKLGAAVDALLNFAKPLAIKPQKVRLQEVVANVGARLAGENPDIRLSVANDANSEINGDPELLERALENVIRNAADAVHQQHPDGGGTIDVSLTNEPHPTILIRDNGVGFDAEQAAAFLLPFQSGKSHGFGLGLPLARKIVLHHGGTLTLTGSPGEGATVRFEFFG